MCWPFATSVRQTDRHGRRASLTQSVSIIFNDNKVARDGRSTRVIFEAVPISQPPQYGQPQAMHGYPRHCMRRRSGASCSSPTADVRGARLAHASSLDRQHGAARWPGLVPDGRNGQQQGSAYRGEHDKASAGGHRANTRHAGMLEQRWRSAVAACDAFSPRLHGADRAHWRHYARGTGLPLSCRHGHAAHHRERSARTRPA